MGVDYRQLGLPVEPVVFGEFSVVEPGNDAQDHVDMGRVQRCPDGHGSPSKVFSRTGLKISVEGEVVEMNDAEHCVVNAVTSLLMGIREMGLPATP
ncbi:hypothetical protein ACFUNF_42480 [Streptomyces sp. NPDC057291]|uniref:hypothetical protein n=1 Tax=Streptomyces sp. NPDC057291 TaxID=3346087 RepID=UPI00363DE58B